MHMHKQVVTAMIATATAALTGAGLIAGTGAATARVDDGRYVLHRTGGVFTPTTAAIIRNGAITYEVPGRPTYRIQPTRAGGYYDQSAIQRLTFRKHGGAYQVEAYVFGIKSGTARMVPRG